jgi:hypothetical protein
LKAALIVVLSASVFAQSRTVAITVDDPPYAGDKKGTSAEAINAKCWPRLSATTIPVTGFVIEKRVKDIGCSPGTSILKGMDRT